MDLFFRFSSLSLGSRTRLGKPFFCALRGARPRIERGWEFASAVERLRDAWQWFDLCDPEYAAAAVLNLESAMKAAGAAFIRAKFSRAKAASAEAHKADTLLVRFCKGV